jgi:hypothetical protein
MKRLLSIIIVLLLVSVILAQEATPEITPEATAEVTPESTVSPDACPMLVQQALNLTELNCDATSTNEACYGFIDIDAETRSSNIRFVNPGDIVQVLELQGVQLSPMDIQNGLWGLMVMDVEANTTDGSVALDNVQIVLFGDTQLRDASRFVQVTALSDIDIYEKPGMDSSVISTLAKDDSIIVNSQLEDGSWLRVRFNEPETGNSLIGWLQTELVTTVSDLSILQTLTLEQAAQVPDDLSVQYGPMQAFIFESGQKDAPCAEAPNSGMMIQTPEGAASVTFVMDEVVVTMNGTGVITAQADGNMSVIVVDGEATVEANGVASTAQAGQAIDVAINRDLSPVGTPGDARDITADEVQGLPTSLLDDPVTVPSPDSNMPRAGAWTFVLDTPLPLICPDGTTITYASAGIAASIEPQIDSLIVSGLRYNEIAPGVYSASYSDASGNFNRDTLRVVNSSRISGDRTIDMATSNCTLSVNYHYELTDPK